MLWQLASTGQRHFREGGIGSGAKGSCLDSKEQLVAPFYLHTRVPCALNPKESHSDACCCPQHPLLGPFSFLSAPASLSVQRKLVPSGDSLGHTENMVLCQHTLLGQLGKQPCQLPLGP